MRVFPCRFISMRVYVHYVIDRGMFVCLYTVDGVVTSLRAITCGHVSEEEEAFPPLT